MNYLTLSELAKVAPASQRLRPKDPGLLDTTAFLRHIEADRGFRPVLAVQGTAHEDSLYGARKGRHLVVAANDRGDALILLNSHSGRRKTWMGTGFVATVEDRPVFVTAAAIPIARWRGFEEPLRELDKWLGLGRDVRSALMGWSPGAVPRRSISADYAEAAYLSNHKKAAPDAFADIESRNAFELMFQILARALNGNLPAASGVRRLKPIKGPDAVMQASNAAFTTMVHRHGGAGLVPFPHFRKT